LSAINRPLNRNGQLKNEQGDETYKVLSPSFFRSADLPLRLSLKNVLIASGGHVRMAVVLPVNYSFARWL
jgi:hypothetical protein